VVPGFLLRNPDRCSRDREDDVHRLADELLGEAALPRHRDPRAASLALGTGEHSGVRVEPGREQPEAEEVPTTACLRCHDIREYGPKAGFSRIPMLAAGPVIVAYMRIRRPWVLLAAAGVGTLGVVDDDAVALSNLQRQVIHATPDIGMPKIDSAAAAAGIRARSSESPTQVDNEVKALLRQTDKADKQSDEDLKGHSSGGQ